MALAAGNNDCIELGTPLKSGQTQVCNNQNQGGAIMEYLKTIIQFISGLVGVVIVLMIIWSGIQYITAAGNPELLKQAKDRFYNAIVGLILFILMFGILSYLIPGGIFKL